MRSFWAMVTASLKMAIRNRTALFWNLAFPALFILIFGAVLGGDESIELSVGVAGEESALRQGALLAMERSGAFSVHTGTEAAEVEALEAGDRSVVAVFGPGAAEASPQVTLYYDETQGPNSQIALSVVRQVLVETAGGGDLLDISQQGVRGSAISFIEFFVPGILAMSLMNSGVIGLATVFVSYRERGILRRIKVTPVPLGRFLLASVVARLIMAVAQCLILVGMAWAIYDLEIRGNVLVITIVVVIGALAFLAIGFAIAAIARTVEAAESYANLVTLPMLFLSGVFFSVDTAPGWLEPLTRLLPLRYLVDALREPMTRGLGLGAIWLDLLILVATFAVALGFAVRFFRWDPVP